MKKVIFSICCVGAMTFVACTEDRGTTTEVADANHDENVDPNHIKGYGNQPAHTNADQEGDGSLAAQQQSSRIVSMMASDLNLDKETEKKVLAVINQQNMRINELEDRYGYSETVAMGGQANNDTENDTSANQNTNLDASRPNNRGNKYMGRSAQNDELGNNLNMNETQMNTERSKIQAEADKELKAILTPEQYKTYSQNRTKYQNPGAATAGQKSQSN